MADVPLTEKRFLELLNLTVGEEFIAIKKRFEQIDTRFKQMDTRFDLIDKKLNDLQGFQDHEADAIEYELKRFLEEYLKQMYPNNTVSKYKMNEIKDPYTDKAITRLDAAFLIEPYKYPSNYTRLKKQHIPLPSKQEKILGPNIFILAEAKHFIDKEKIAIKISQFDRIMNSFKLAKLIKSSNDVSKLELHPNFIKTVQCNPYVSNIDISNSLLIFGAAFWTKGLIDNLHNDINKRKELVNQFTIANDEDKIKIYNQICSIDNRWYKNDCSLKSHEYILKLKDLSNALSFIKIIVPSGGRYDVMKEESSDALKFAFRGGGKTRKMRP